MIFSFLYSRFNKCTCILSSPSKVIFCPPYILPFLIVKPNKSQVQFLFFSKKSTNCFRHLGHFTWTCGCFRSCTYALMLRQLGAVYKAPSGVWKKLQLLYLFEKRWIIHAASCSIVFWGLCSFLMHLCFLFW